MATTDSGSFDQVVDRLTSSFLAQGIFNGLKRVGRDRMAKIYLGYLLFVITLGAIGPEITPYGYEQYMYTDSGQLMRIAPPSLEHPLGTTENGFDVLSRVMYGARPTVLTGILGGTVIIAIGSTVGITAGYFGGRVDNVLMRVTDFVYGVPLIPFAIVLLATFGMGFFTSILVIGLILWRSSARVLRSQVLQIKERPYITAAKATGASHTHVIIKHIVPNIAPMAVLLFSLGLGYAIIVQASLAFIGVVNPFVPSWGVMLRNAYKSGVMELAWWWSIPPGVLISSTVLSAFMFGRKFVKEESDEAMAGAG